MLVDENRETLRDARRYGLLFDGGATVAGRSGKFRTTTTTTMIPIFESGIDVASKVRFRMAQMSRNNDSIRATAGGDIDASSAAADNAPPPATASSLGVLELTGCHNRLLHGR